MKANKHHIAIFLVKAAYHIKLLYIVCTQNQINHLTITKKRPLINIAKNHILLSIEDIVYTIFSQKANPTQANI